MKRNTPQDAPCAPEAETPEEEALGEQLLELILEAEGERAAPAKERLDGVLVGRLVGFSGDDGRPLVSYGGCTSADGIVARSTAKLERDDVGQELALMFEGGDPSQPIVMGPLRYSADDSAVQVEVDGERTVVSAEREIVLRCGQASITLTRAGKVLIRGEYVLTRSAGVNRIQGGSVQIN